MAWLERAVTSPVPSALRFRLTRCKSPRGNEPRPRWREIVDTQTIVTPLSPEHERLLTVAIETVERLELLLVLRRERPKAFTAKSLRSGFSARGAVDSNLAFLCGRGFLGVTIGNDLVYEYRPISTKIEQQVTEIADAWQTRRAEVARLLGAAGGPRDAASAFADAFRIRRRDDDG